MTNKQRVLFSWSGGKDSAMALDVLRQDERYEIVCLLTSVAEEFRRISHHGVREELLVEQAHAIGLPLDILYLPVTVTNEQCEALIEEKLRKYAEAGVRFVAHGDIFLEDLRQYRERNLARLGMQGLFPIWQRDTTELVHCFIDQGFQAYISCAEAVLGERFAGRAIDATFLYDLPAGVDPCGENGEYHTFVHAGPIFQHALSVRRGPVVVRDGRYYADLLLDGK